MRTRNQVAAEKRKMEEETNRIEEEKRTKFAFAPIENAQIGTRDIYAGQKDPVEVKVEVKSEDSKVGAGQMDFDRGFKEFAQIGKIEENVVFVKYEEIIEESDETSISGEEMVVVVEDGGLDEQNTARDDQDGMAAEETGWTPGNQMNVEMDDKGISEENITKVIPHILPLLTQKDAFRCRLVNKQWRLVVDKFLEDCLVPQHFDNQGSSSQSQLCPFPKFRKVESAYDFKSEKSIRKFNEIMAPHVQLQQSPFVGNATVILTDLFGASTTPKLEAHLTLFLEKFGMYIRNLVVKHYRFDVIRFVDFVKMWLHFVPNLERLNIIGSRRVETEQGEISRNKKDVHRNELVSHASRTNQSTALAVDKDNSQSGGGNYIGPVQGQYMPSTPYYLTCQVCGSPFNTTSMKSQHVPIHNGPHQCGTCTLPFVYKSGLRRHQIKKNH